MKTAVLRINREEKCGTVSRHIYGHFSEHLGRCIYDGIYVGEDSAIPNVHGIRKDVLEALQEIHVPVLRWPGGCFADEYHWKDGIGEKASRKKMVNTNWGGVVEDNRFGTHEFLDLCELLHCEPYIAGNMGSGTVQEMAEWVEYMTFDGVSPMTDLRRKNGREKPWHVKFFGIGNESWGCGGNMRPEYYADEYRRYQTFCKNYSGNTLYKVACGPNAGDYHWTEKIMEQLKPWHTDAIALHYYTVPSGNWEKKGSATDFTDAEYYQTIAETLKMEELIDRHSEIMDRYDPDGNIKLIVDEWGCWYDVEPGTHPGFLYQQNSMRDAIVAACNLNLFNQKCKRVVMANLAQAVNVLQAVLLTDGAKLVKTPTYQVFRMFVPHQDATLLSASLSGFTAGTEESQVPALSGSVTEGTDGTMFVTISNCSLSDDCALEINADGVLEAQIITAEKPQAYNDFGKVPAVELKPYHGYTEKCGKTILTVPRCSVVSVRFA